MKSQSTIVAALFAQLFAIASHGQQTVLLNIDARIAGDPTHPVGTPVLQSFSPGIYSCTLVSPADSPQALFTDWTAWADATNYRLTDYLIASTNGSLIAYGGLGHVVVGAPGVAFAATTNKTTVLNITSATVLRFGVSDIVIGDNSGGVSLLIVKQVITGTNTVPLSIQMVSNALAQVSWPSETNRLYQALYSPSLARDSWQPLGEARIGLGQADFIIDPFSGQQSRFYRVFCLQ